MRQLVVIVTLFFLGTSFVHSQKNYLWGAELSMGSDFYHDVHFSLVGRWANTSHSIGLGTKFISDYRLGMRGASVNYQFYPNGNNRVCEFYFNSVLDFYFHQYSVETNIIDYQTEEQTSYTSFHREASLGLMIGYGFSLSTKSGIYLSTNFNIGPIRDHSFSHTESATEVTYHYVNDRWKLVPLVQLNLGWYFGKLRSGDTK